MRSEPVALESLQLPDPQTLRLSVDAVRVLSMDAVQQANSGHPGTPMALAPAAYLLFRHHLRHNPANPAWPDRDRFVLSLGHASMLLYSALHLSGYDLTLDELRAFRQWGSRTAGHPEYHEIPGIETTTGPLGQGVANSVGMALAERWLSHRFNRPGHTVMDHFTYAFCSDGDLMEGISHEAAEIAGHQKLGKLIWVFDDNGITIEGGTDLASSTDVLERFRSYGWHVQRVDDGNDLEALDRALREARSTTDRPSLIALRTVIGWGSPGKAGSSDAHGAPLGAEEIRRTKENLGYPSEEPFWVAEEAVREWGQAVPRGAAFEADWAGRMDRFRSDFPAEAAELEAFLSGDLPVDWTDALVEMAARFQNAPKPQATRVASGTILQGISARLPHLLGGSADLGPSNMTEMEAAGSLLPQNLGGRNLHFGVREHGMGAILNGLALHGGVRTFGGTFLIFSDYMRPAIRMAALMGLPVVYVFTHDSIGLGEDGPTHQPVEQLMSLRSLPNLLDLRPADALETVEAWRIALERKDGPTFLSLTRQAVPLLARERTPSPEDIARGGYILQEAQGGSPEVLLLASGSEVHLAVDAANQLEASGIPTRVISLVSWFLLQRQPSDYLESLLPRSVTARVSIEAGSTFGWRHWLGSTGLSIGLDRFGASAPANRLYQEFGITVDAVVAAARQLHAHAST
jgi:transketolase